MPSRQAYGALWPTKLMPRILGMPILISGYYAFFGLLNAQGQGLRRRLAHQRKTELSTHELAPGLLGGCGPQA